MIPNRRPCVTETVGRFMVTVSYDPETLCPIELFFTKRAKAGTLLEDILYDVGVAASKLMQRETIPDVEYEIRIPKTRRMVEGDL